MRRWNLKIIWWRREKLDAGAGALANSAACAKFVGHRKKYYSKDTLELISDDATADHLKLRSFFAIWGDVAPQT